MKIRKLVSALCIAAGLAFAGPALAPLTGVTGGMATVQAADGWGQDDIGYFYLENDTRVTGLKKIDGATYYFTTDGYRATGPVKINKTTYYFNPGNGKLLTGQSGMVQIGKGSDVYYYFQSKKNGTLTTSKWVKFKGKYFYADENGQVKLGTIKVKKKLYHITKNGRMTAYGKSSYDKKYYYASKNGTLLTGLRKINGKLYYFDTKTGERKTGTVTVGKNTYYFSTQAGYARTGWIKVDKKYYYFDKNYKRITGWKTINNKKYYLNPKKNGARVTSSWCKIGKHYYYFDSKGVMKTGFFNVGDKRYYSDSQGIRRKGWRTVNNRKYYLDSSTGVMKFGWFTYKNKKYYLNPNKTAASYGAAVVGWYKISGSTYYFNNDGTMKTGWHVENGKKYYLGDKTGKMLTGKQKINGITYDFGKNGYISQKISDIPGSWVVKVNRKQCFVVVYKGNTEVKAFVCSTARDGTSTPTGTFSIQDKLYWHELMGPTWGQYCSHITSDILFHSVPNTKYRDPYSLETWEYNKLGSPASAGCIRLSVMHAKWLFDNVPIGTKVIVSDSVAKPKQVSIEWPPKQSPNKYYDPTDTFVNPYSVR